LPDFYDTNYDTGGWFEGTGNWDIMAGGSWNGNGSRPAHFNMYTKVQKGWVTPVILNTPTVITDMPNAAENAVAYRINTTTANEYFLLENRQRVKFDLSVPGSGLLIYHVHRNVGTWGINDTHPQRMYPVCASAEVAIPNSNPSSYGKINSGGCPFPGTKNNTSFTDDGIPSMKAWDGANTSKPITHIKNVSGLISFNFMTDICLPARNLTVNYFTDCSKATISWWAPEFGSDFKYNVYRGDIKIANAISETSFVDNGFTPTQNQKWSVAALCDTKESELISLTKPACSNIGIEDNELYLLNIFSHQNTVYINNVDVENLQHKLTVEIHDMIGRLVYQNTIIGNETKITLQVAGGIYNVKVFSQDGNLIMKKILISK
jgi:hypothetical protein